MATLIPAIGSCVSRMTGGERRLAERLEQKLDDDYLIWYDVPIGPKQSHPDFTVLHPRRGLLVLEVKDWRLDTIREADRQSFVIAPDGLPKTVANPAEQARHHAHQVVDALKRDAHLVFGEGRHQGQLRFPWGYGVVLSNITRRQFLAAELDEAIDPRRVVCRDEMAEAVEAEDFQQRLWAMFTTVMREPLTLPEIDRVRWTLFPSVRITTQGELPGMEADSDVPDIVRVMDLQQEQLARSLGDGHRVVHGVAGSGKTLILGYRAELLARATSPSKPILVLCYNEPLAVKVASVMAAKGLSDRVVVRHFHKWCRQQLVAFGQPIPQGEGVFDQLVDGVIRGVDRGWIPRGQYRAVMVDEGHDFQPAWLKLIVQMVDPDSQSLLVLYDDAQNIYDRGRGLPFSFKSVGIQAQGRTTILRVNYRNPREVLRTARRLASHLLHPAASDDDGVPLVEPVSGGRDGAAPLVIHLPTLRDEATKVAELMSDAHKTGHSWSDMAVLCRRHHQMDLCAEALARRRMPFQVRKRTGDYDPSRDAIVVMTMHASKGLEFPVVALVGVGEMPGPKESEAEEARLFYVAATRATESLAITLSGQGAFGERLRAA